MGKICPSASLYQFGCFLMQDYYVLSCDFATCHIWNNISRTGLMYNAKKNLAQSLHVYKFVIIQEQMGIYSGLSWKTPLEQ